MEARSESVSDTWLKSKKLSVLLKTVRWKDEERVFVTRVGLFHHTGLSFQSTSSYCNMRSELLQELTSKHLFSLSFMLLGSFHPGLTLHHCLPESQQVLL